MEQRTLETQQGILHYWVAGEGLDALVLLHGLGEDHEVFLSQQNFFQDHFRVLVLDLPGHGASRPWKDFQLDTAAEAVHRIIIRENIQSLHLLGYAEGGLLAQEYAATYPGRLQSLTLLGTLPFGKTYYRGYRRFLIQGVAAMNNIFPKRWKNTLESKMRARTRSGQELLLEKRNQHSKAEMRVLQKAFHLGFFHRKEETAIRLPLLLVLGERDTSFMTRKTLIEWSDREGHLLDVVTNAGHAAHVDNPEEFNAKLMGFLDRVVKPRDYSNVTKYQNTMLNQTFLLEQIKRLSR